jgi:hypothetical protein
MKIIYQANQVMLFIILENSDEFNNSLPTDKKTRNQKSRRKKEKANETETNSILGNVVDIESSIIKQITVNIF